MTTDDRTLYRQLETSRVVGAVDRVRTVTLSALQRSRTMLYLARASANWPPGPTQMANGGVVLIVAALVHLALTDYERGWMTLIVPGLAAGIGILAVVMSSRQPRLP